jgi:hypothetical protein
MAHRFTYQYSTLVSSNTGKGNVNREAQPGYHLPQSRRLIRLITLLPGTITEDICVTLEIVDLDAKPYYDAVSYVWGSEADPVRISIGHKWCINVTQNLAAA